MYIEGSGTPLLVIPGIQGRWEWMGPALKALARGARVISYSLCGDIGSGSTMDPALGFEAFTRQVDQVLDRAGVGRVALCGVSFGGIIAVRYAALHPDRVSHLILASTPGPSWKPSARQARYVSRPWVSVPAFCVTAVDRLSAEIREALPDWPTRIGFMLGYVVNALAAPMMPGLMARRVRLQQSLNLMPDCLRVTAPTLVITGDPELDRVVPVESTKEYLTLIPGARHVVMEHTGHLGLLTQADRFASIVSDFLQRSHGSNAEICCNDHTDQCEDFLQGSHESI